MGKKIDLTGKLFGRLVDLCGKEYKVSERDLLIAKGKFERIIKDRLT